MRSAIALEPSASCIARQPNLFLGLRDNHRCDTRFGRFPEISVYKAISNLFEIEIATCSLITTTLAERGSTVFGPYGGGNARRSWEVHRPVGRAFRIRGG